jgi:predicted nucleic acid-binding protein
VPPQAAKAAVHAFEHYDVVTVTTEIIAEAIDCSIVSQLSFWDALIVSAAESACCEPLLTEDLQAGQVL